MKKVFLGIFLFFISLSLVAGPATPYPILVTQPDGTTLTLKMQGDEYYHFYTLEDGTPMVRQTDGFWVKDTRSIEQLQQLSVQRRSVSQPSRAAGDAHFPLIGSPKSLVLLVGFKDLPFNNQLEDFNNLLNQSGYSYAGRTGSARDYYIASSDSLFQPYFDVYGPYTLSRDIAYYGAPGPNFVDIRPGEMVSEACMLADADGVDFSQYDTDGDGILDNVFVFYAGNNENQGAGENAIWPHQSNIQSMGVRIDGKLVATYACSAEHTGSSGKVRTGIGSFCHEFGHVLGLPDLYDTQYNYYSVANWSIMCSGSHNDGGYTPPVFSAYERFYLGWLKPQQLSEKGEYTLLPLSNSNQAYLIAANTHNMNGERPNPSEFFLLEYRTRTGWDAYLPGQGMLVWHIDYQYSAWVANTPNNGPNIMRIHLEEANGIYWNQRKNGEEGRSSDPYPGTQKVTAFVPKLHDGTVLSEHNIFEITENDGWISFVHQSLGDVKMSLDRTQLSITTTVSDDKKIVDWNPQSFNLTVEGLNEDTITIVAKSNFYVAVGDTAPARSSKEWKRTTGIKTTDTNVNAKVWVSYIPSKQTCEELSSSLTVSTLGASQTVMIKAYSPRPVYVTTPVFKPTTNITPYSFRIAWHPVQDAVLYYLTLFQSKSGESSFLQGFENFNDEQAIIEEGWISTTNTITTSAKSEGTKSLYLKKTGDQITTPNYFAPVKSISFWLNAFTSELAEIGVLDLEAWNGTEWILLADNQTTILSTTKRKTITIDLDPADHYVQFRLTYTDLGGSGVAMDAFIVTCTQEITFLSRGKELSIDAFEDEALCVYEVVNLNPSTDYYYCMQASDVTKGCVENVTPLSEPIKVQTVAVDDAGKDDNQLPLAVDSVNYDALTHLVYLSSPQNGDILYIYNALGEQVYSCPVLEGVSEYVIPVDRLHKNTLYVIKVANRGKLKRKYGWAKFML